MDFSTITSFFSGTLANITLALVIVILSIVIGKLVSRTVRRLLNEIELDLVVKKAGLNFGLEGIFADALAYFIYAIGLIMALNQLGITATIFYIISIGVMALVIFSMLLALKDFMPNLFSGFLIYKKGIVSVGESIKVDGVEGKVAQISLLETRIEMKNKHLAIIPNATLLKHKIVKKVRP